MNKLQNVYTYALENRFTCKVHRCRYNVLSGHIIIISYHKKVKGLTNKSYTYALARKKTGLHAKFQVHRCFDMDLVCIVMYCQDTLKEVKGLTNKLYAYALAWKKTGLPAKFQSHRCYG